MVRHAATASSRQLREQVPAPDVNPAWIGDLAETAHLPQHSGVSPRQWTIRPELGPLSRADCPFQHDTPEIQSLVGSLDRGRAGGWQVGEQADGRTVWPTAYTQAVWAETDKSARWTW